MRILNREYLDGLDDGEAGVLAPHLPDNKDYMAGYEIGKKYLQHVTYWEGRRGQAEPCSKQPTQE